MIVLLLILIQYTGFSISLPLCSRSGDTLGTWISNKAYENSPILQAHVHERFIFGGPGEARNFSHIWIPDDCSYHRFTDATLRSMARYIQNKTQTSTPLRLMFLGDSGTRGIVCGITRILSGSEIDGPCENEICGTVGKLPVSFSSKHLLENVNFDSDFELSFMYILSLVDQYTGWMVENNVGKKPYAVVVNTGAWDFNSIARHHMGDIANDLCDAADMEQVSVRRAQPSIRDMMHETGGQATALGVRAIYRTNHHNARYGSHCADDRFLAAIKGSGWEVWDNRRISHDVWRHQTTDGFHYDRENVHTVEQHIQQRHNMTQQGKGASGMLEMQLTQSLLHLLFRDVLQELMDQGLDIHSIP